MKKVVIKLTKAFIYLTSLTFFILYWFNFNAIFNLISIFASSIFLTLLTTSFHELGHVFICRITNTKINYVKIFSFMFVKNSIEILTSFSLSSYVSFEKNNNKNKILLFGPIFSLILCLIEFIIYILTMNNMVLFILLIGLIVSFISIMPHKYSDIKQMM